MAIHTGMNLKFSMTMKIHLRPSGEADTNSSHDLIMMSSCYSVVYLGPSVTPYKYNNPAYRIYELNNDKTFQLVDFHVYFLNLTTANSKYGNPTWQYLYGANVR